MSTDSLRRTALEVLASPGNHRFGRGVHYLLPEVCKHAGGQVAPRQLMAVLWQLLAEGLVFIDYEQPSPENWLWVITERGRRVVSSGEYEPDDPEGYVRRLQSRVDSLDELVVLYTREALHAYSTSCYLASAVMLGVASERAFQVLGEAIVTWLPHSEAVGFRRVFENPRQAYQAKFLEFRKRLEPHKPDLPLEFSESMALTLDSVLDLLRIARNEAGHPTGRRVDREDAYISLQMFARYVEKMFKLRAFFKADATAS